MFGMAGRERDIDNAEQNSEHGLVQIGDLARRVGVRVATLRAWERRYGLLHPSRSAGGFRLYSSDDEATVRAMIAEIDRGYPPSQAAKLALAWANSSDQALDNSPVAVEPAASATIGNGAARLETVRGELLWALRDFDGTRAQALFDGLLGDFTVNAVLHDVTLPCLKEIGDGWARGDVTIAEEHFASQLLRERLLGLARDWDQGRGPRALLACPADERHDIGLICFGLVLARNGWRITFLGPETPVDALADAAHALAPDLIVLAATVEERFSSIIEPLRALAASHELALAGAGAGRGVARTIGATQLEGGPVPAARRIAARRPHVTGTKRPATV